MQDKKEHPFVTKYNAIPAEEVKGEEEQKKRGEEHPFVKKYNAIPAVASSPASEENIPTTPQDTNKEEYTYGDRALQGVRGAITAVPGLVDLGAHAAGFGAKKLGYESVGEFLSGIDLAGHAGGGFDDFVNAVGLTDKESLEPTDSTGEAVSLAGGIASGGVSGALSKATIKQGAKAALKVSGSAAGAGVAHKVHKDSDGILFSKETSPIASAIEGFLVDLTGAAAGGSLATAGTNTVGLLGQAVKKLAIGDTLKKAYSPENMKIYKEEMKSIFKKTDFDPEVLQASEALGLEVPTFYKFKSDLANARLQNAIAQKSNDYLIEDFVKRYEGAVKDKFKEALSSASPVSKEPNALGNELKGSLYALESEAGKKANNLYESLNGLIKTDDIVDVKNTLNAINAAKSSTKDYSDAGQSVLSILNKIENDIVKDNSLKNIYNAKKALNTLYDKNLGHSERAKINSVAKELNSDLYKSSNKEFTQALRETDNWYKDNFSKTFKSDLVKGIIGSEKPERILNNLSSIENVKLLEKTLGTSKKSKDLLGDLKRAKAESILGSEGGSLNNVLNAKNSANKELLSYLLGEEKMKELRHINTLTQKFFKPTFSNRQESFGFSALGRGIHQFLNNTFSFITRDNSNLSRSEFESILKEYANVKDQNEFLKFVTKNKNALIILGNDS